ncbi:MULTISPECIES: cyclophilin-like fold protein [unclassified Streptomyces]|uniref:cyclophilin-like fold protein n=1 Tax=unclassified Streptomyces TaxID=2593676 RepID=UPI0036ED3EFE
MPSARARARIRAPRAALPAAVAATVLAAAGCTTNTGQDAPGPGPTATGHTSATVLPPATAPEGKDIMKIRMTTDAGTFEATLNDSAAARDFAGLLPLTLNLSDYAGTEKVSELPQKLTTAGSPTGTAATAGDLTYYAPWGNLAIFYKDFHHADGLVKIGEFASGMEQFARPSGDFEVTITAAR